MTDEYKGGIENTQQEETSVEYNENPHITSEEHEEPNVENYSEQPENGAETYDDYRNEFSEYNDITSTDGLEEYETTTGTADDVVNGLDTIFNSLGAGTPDISNVVLGALTLTAGASGFVMNMRKKLKNKALEYINIAEEEFINQNKSGKSKKTFAIQAMTSSVPALLRPFVSASFAEKAIDSSFSNMSKFAKLQNATGTTEHEPQQPKPHEDENTDEERFAPIIDLIKNKGKSIEIENPETLSTTVITPGDIAENSDGGYTEGCDKSEESKSPVVVNLYLEQPDGSYVKESRKQENNNAVNIDIRYKCRYAGENNSVCRECAFNDNRPEYELERREVYG